MTQGKKFPKEIIEHWPEVFGDITLNVVPVQYLESITIKFKNSKVWEIKLNSKVKKDMIKNTNKFLKRKRLK